MGYVPVGAVSRNLGTGTAIGLASSVSVFAVILRRPVKPADLKNNPNASDGPCRSEERTVPRIAGPLVALGMLVAFACVGLWPTSKYQQAGTILSSLAGFAVIPSIAPIVPPFFLWVVPILTVGGGASVALSSRQ